MQNAVTHAHARRVVAGLNSAGQSCVVLDNYAELQAFGGTSIAQIWTGSLDGGAFPPVAQESDGEAFLAQSSQPFRFEQMSDPAYAFMVAEYAPGLGRDDPGMHRTDTIDHFHVIKGEVVLVLEREEVILRAGDSGVCRGVVHGWRNDGEKIARLVTVTLPAR